LKLLSIAKMDIAVAQSADQMRSLVEAWEREELEAEKEKIGVICRQMMQRLEYVVGRDWVDKNAVIELVEERLKECWAREEMVNRKLALGRPG
jgi:CRISPR/Cas system CSM-associated protein Csm2 small subunit